MRTRDELGVMKPIENLLCGFRGVRRVGGVKPTRRIRYAAIVAGEVGDLLIPTGRLAAEFMNEDNGVSLAPFFEPKLYPVLGRRERHASPDYPVDIAGTVAQLVKNFRSVLPEGWGGAFLPARLRNGISGKAHLAGVLRNYR